MSAVLWSTTAVTEETQGSEASESAAGGVKASTLEQLSAEMDQSSESRPVTSCPL